MKNTNKNFVYNVIYQFLTFIIPLVITPYISRKLGVENIGIYSYTYSFVYYFMLASMIGINNYGAREIAKCKTKEETGHTFKSIYYLQLLLNIICIFLYYFSLFFIQDNLIIYIIQSIFLISVGLDINWFYFGKEKFKITISRNIIIKFLSMILIFIFVNENSDLWKYTLIMSLSTLISQMYLWLFIKREITNTKVKITDSIKHLKPCLVLFIPVVAYSIYRVMDKTMIGLFSGKIELGYYESAEKIVNIPIGIITALGTVMMPHMSKKNEQEIKNSIQETFKLTFFMLIPMIIGIFLISKEFSIVFFGSEFEKTGYILQVLIISILFSGIANVIRTNYLIPLKKDKIYVLSTVIGAIINLVLNLIFIPEFGSFGACIGTVGAEFFVMIYQVLNTYKNIDFIKMLKNAFGFVVKSFIMGIFMIILSHINCSSITKIFIQILGGVFIYCILNIKYIIFEFFGKSKKE